ncbi:MAG: hypothetical protein MUE36_05260 [Acidimicrobiales bacterium]|jgi:single-strand DNA-binding protein|nr:hypothetical protein [Acidimicrobiales bacterium]
MSVPDPIVNVAVLCGTVVREPEVRVLASGAVLLGYEVRVGGRPPDATTVPVVWPDPPARRPTIAAGDVVVVVGHVRRRFFRVGGATQSRTEVVAERIRVPRSGRHARDLVEQALVGAGEQATAGG